MGRKCLTVLLVALAINSAVSGQTAWGPQSWPVITTCIWLVYVLHKGWQNMDAPMTAQVRGSKPHGLDSMQAGTLAPLAERDRTALHYSALAHYSRVGLSRESLSSVQLRCVQVRLIAHAHHLKPCDGSSRSVLKRLHCLCTPKQRAH